jgi:hypothetical protein
MTERKFFIILMPDVQKVSMSQFQENGGRTTFILERISSVKIHESPQRKTVENPIKNFNGKIEKLENFLMKKIIKGKFIKKKNPQFPVQVFISRSKSKEK